MGLWRDVVLTTSPTSAVTCRYPGVRTTLSKDNTAAAVEVTAELKNWGSTSTSGHFQVELGKLGTAEVAVLGCARGAVWSRGGVTDARNEPHPRSTLCHFRARLAQGKVCCV